MTADIFHHNLLKSYASRRDLKILAQTAFFISIVITQIGNVIACKTKRMSVFQKGMRYIGNLKPSMDRQ